MIRTKGAPGTGDIVQAVRHMKQISKEIAHIFCLKEDELLRLSKEMNVSYKLLAEVKKSGNLPVINFAVGGIAIPADAALMMHLEVKGFLQDQVFLNLVTLRKERRLLFKK